MPVLTRPVQTRPVRTRPVGQQGPMYSKKLGGFRERMKYRDLAGEASALSRMAPAGRGNYQPWRQRARNLGLDALRGQTVLHFGIRRQILNDLERHDTARAESLRRWAEMSLRGEQDQAERELAQKKLELQERGTESLEDYRTRSLGLRERELGALQERETEQRADLADYRQGQMALELLRSVAAGWT